MAIIFEIPTDPKWSWETNRNAHCIDLKAVVIHVDEHYVKLDGISKAGRYITGGIQIDRAAWDEIIAKYQG